MSFMPNPGTRVRMKDGRNAVVSNVDPLGKDDRVRFSDGHEETTDAWQIGAELEMEPLYIEIAKNRRIAKTVDVNDCGDVFIDLDENGEIVGIEVLANYRLQVDGRDKEVIR